MQKILINPCKNQALYDIIRVFTYYDKSKPKLNSFLPNVGGLITESSFGYRMCEQIEPPFWAFNNLITNKHIKERKLYYALYI